MQPQPLRPRAEMAALSGAGADEAPACEHHPPLRVPRSASELCRPRVKFHFSSGYVLKLFETDPVTADLTASRSL
jgi:hypothetical protein